MIYLILWTIFGYSLFLMGAAAVITWLIYR